MFLPLLKKFWWAVLSMYIFVTLINIDMPATYISLFRGILLILSVFALGYRFSHITIKYDIRMAYIYII